MTKAALSPEVTAVIRSGLELLSGGDQLWPRDAEHRYRIYAKQGDTLVVLAACPTAGGIGQAIVQLHEDQKAAGRRLCDLGRVGVMDVMPDGKPSPTGEWILSMWDRGSGA